MQLAYLLAQFQYFVCPVGYNSETYRFTVECEPSELFLLQEYTLPAVVQNTLGKVGLLCYTLLPPSSLTSPGRRDPCSVFPLHVSSLLSFPWSF